MTTTPTDPITIGFLRETAQEGTAFCLGNCTIPLSLSADAAWGKFELHIKRGHRGGFRRALLYSWRSAGDGQGGYGNWLYLPPLRTVGDLQTLWRVLTGREWGSERKEAER